MDPDVPVVLLEGEFVAVAVAAQALEALAHGEDPHLRGVGLGDRGQEVEEELVAFLLLPFGDQGKVHVAGALEDERERSLDDGALEQQHPLYVGVVDDRDLRRQGVLPGDGPALGALPCVFEGGVVGRRGDRRGPHPDVEARLVHHLEHVAKPLVGLADEPAPAVVVVPEGKLGDRGAPVADLVVDADAGHVVAGKAAPGRPGVFSARRRARSP